MVGSLYSDGDNKELIWANGTPVTWFNFAIVIAVCVLFSLLFTQLLFIFATASNKEPTEEAGGIVGGTNQDSFDSWGLSGQCEELQYPESIMPEDDILRLARYNRAGQLIALVRGRQPWDGRDHQRAAEAQRILGAIDAACPEWADEVFNLGLYESGYLQHGLRGDWRKWKRKSEDEMCPDGWERTARGCYDRDSCEPEITENCIPTSCSYWQIRDIYRGRPTCSELVYNIDAGIEWACDWVASNWPNVAAYNAGHGGSRAGRAQPYANRVFIGVELLRGRGDINEWTFENRRFIHAN